MAVDKQAIRQYVMRQRRKRQEDWSDFPHRSEHNFWHPKWWQLFWLHFMI